MTCQVSVLDLNMLHMVLRLSGIPVHYLNIRRAERQMSSLSIGFLQLFVMVMLYFKKISAFAAIKINVLLPPKSIFHILLTAVQQVQQLKFLLPIST